MTESIIRKTNRVTIALDEKCFENLQKMSEELQVSHSELVRKSIEFYKKYKDFLEKGNGAEKRLNTYIEMLSAGEHIILDVDHYLSFLKFIEESPNKEKFWENHKEIGRSHAEQFHDKFESFEDVLRRLETCNFFKMVKETSNRYTLLLGSEIPRTFIRTFMEEVLNGMGFQVEIKENLTKLTIFLKNTVL